jgi:hypothetical protein
MCLVAPVATGLCKGAQAARVCSLTESRCLYTIAGTVPCAPYQKQGGDVRWGSKSAKLKLSTTYPLCPDSCRIGCCLATGEQGQLPTSRPIFEERNVSLAGRESRVGQASRGPTDVARDGR